jgi:hypothetical protein
VIYFLIVFFLGGGGESINLKFVFSGSLLVYSEKYGHKKSQGQKKILLPQQPPATASMPLTPFSYSIYFLTKTNNFCFNH